MRRRGLLGLVVVVVLAAGALAYTFAAGNKPFLGLDLQGGVSVVLTPTGQTDDDTLEQARDIIEQRVNALGIAEPEITTQGDNLIVQIPGVKDKDRALELVGQTAELQFRPVLSVTPVGTSVDVSEAPTDTAPTDSAPSDSTSPDATAPADPSSTVTPSSEQGLGLLGEGEQAAGRQTPDTVTDSTAPPTETAPPASTDPGTVDPGTVDPAAAAQATTTQAAPTLPDDVCETGLPAEDNLPDQTVTLPQCDRETNELVAIYTLGPVMLTGDSLETARAALPETQWVVNPVFKGGAEGIDMFNSAAQACNTNSATCPTGQLAIVLDARVISAPAIQQPSFERDQIQISGQFTERSARDLATVLKYGALPVELEQQQAQIVSATLGRDALHAGLWAGAIGFVAVAIYMIAFYRLLGLLAMAKLLVEMAFLWAIISWLGATQGLALTLAGVTGLIVSIGVSLDSNIVYYEHLKEDIRNGRSLRSATDKSFSTSFRTIIAADMASLIGAALLWWLTIGPVRGFALMLAISGVLDLFASYYFMRPAVRWALQSSRAQRNPRAFGLPEEALAPPSGAEPERETAGVGS